MAKSFSSVDEVRRLPDSPLKEILLSDLEPNPPDCGGFRDVLECADSTAVLIEEGDDLHHFTRGGSDFVDLADPEKTYYEYIGLTAGGRMVIATDIWTRYYIPADLLSPRELELFRQRAEDYAGRG